MPTMFWIWMALAAIFLIVELATPTMIFFSFVGGSLAAGILTVFYPESYYWQVGLFLVISAILIPTLRKFATRITVESATPPASPNRSNPARTARCSTKANSGWPRPTTSSRRIHWSRSSQSAGSKYMLLQSSNV